MNPQLNLCFVDSAKRREQLLRDVDFGKRRNRSLMASLLVEIARHKPGECYRSQQCLAELFKVSVKTIQRALAGLQELDLIAIDPRSRTFPDGTTKTVNHYFVNWTALAMLVERQQQSIETNSKPSMALPSDPAENSVPTRQSVQSSSQTDTTVRCPIVGADRCDSYGVPIRQSDVLSSGQTDATVRADRYDSYGVPMRQLEPTDTTVSCPTMDLSNKQLTALEELVVGSDDWTDEETAGTCRALSEFGCNGDVQAAVAAAKSRGWTIAMARAAIADCDPQKPSWLFNWFRLDGSYERYLATRQLAKQQSENLQRGDAMTKAQVLSERRRSQLQRMLNNQMLAKFGRLATDNEVAEAMSNRFDKSNL